MVHDHDPGHGLIANDEEGEGTVDPTGDEAAAALGAAEGAVDAETSAALGWKG